MGPLGRLRSRLTASPGLALSLAGFVLGFVAIFTGLSSTIEGYQRVLLPGDGVLTLSADRGYTVYFEPHSKVAGRTIDSGTIHHLACSLHGPDGTPVALHAGRASDNRYSVHGYSGTYAYSFHSGAAGQYALTCDYTEEASAQVVLAVTDHSAATALIAGLTGMAVTIGIGVAIVVIQLRRRYSVLSSAGRLLVPGLVLAWCVVVFGMFTIGH